ncbi:MAG: hypothetical protein ACLP1Y_14540, partial [Candidatus Acidiferrales bacterium]
MSARQVLTAEADARPDAHDARAGKPDSHLGSRDHGVSTYISFLRRVERLGLAPWPVRMQAAACCGFESVEERSGAGRASDRFGLAQGRLERVEGLRGRDTQCNIYLLPRQNRLMALMNSCIAYYVPVTP